MSISNQIFMQCINQFNDGDCDQIMLETFEDIKRVIRSSKSKDRKYYGQKKKGKWTNNDLQNTTQKTIYWATWTPREWTRVLQKGKQFLFH